MIIIELLTEQREANLSSLSFYHLKNVYALSSDLVFERLIEIF